MIEEIMLHDFTTRLVPSYGGLRIIEDIHMTETVEDWSRVRSPGRARRRRKLGHRQNIVYRQVPKKDAVRFGDALVMHPEIAKALNAMISKQIEEAAARLIDDAVGGGYGAGMLRETGGTLTMDHLTKWRLP